MRMSSQLCMLMILLPGMSYGVCVLSYADRDQAYMRKPKVQRSQPYKSVAHNLIATVYPLYIYYSALDPQRISYITIFRAELLTIVNNSSIWK